MVKPTVSIWQRAADQFNIMIVFLLIMAVMLALVGSLGLTGWGLGVILALPLNKILSQVVGIKFTYAPLSYSFSFVGALVWLGLSLILSAAATYAPARRQPGSAFEPRSPTSNSPLGRRQLDGPAADR